jgi:hypothetical protein
MAKPSPRDARARPHYTDATDRTFRRALDTLKTSLPVHHEALVALVDAGRFDDIDSIVAVFESGGK